MSDARALQVRHERAGCGYADDVVAGVGEGGELGPEQKGQGHVRRGDVDEQGLVQVVAPARRRRLTRRRRSSSMRIPPTTLRSKNASPSSTCTGERASRYGSVAPYGLARVPATAEAKRGHGPVGRRRGSQRLGIGEVSGLDPQPFTDQGDGAVELLVHRGFGKAIEEGVAVGVGADRDESRRHGVRQR